MEPDEHATVVLTDIRDTPLSVDELVTAVGHPRAGAVATFIGVVRDHDHGRNVEGLDYSSHPSAAAVLAEVAGELAQRTDVISIAAVHRTGHLDVGDLAVVVAVSAAHRAPAIEVCHELIDTLKNVVPIWKQQQFIDGTDEWVGIA